MEINLRTTPILHEFYLMQEIRNALKIDDTHYIENFRLNLESANNRQPSDDFKAVLHLSDVAYNNLIDGIKTQKDYNDVYKQVYDEKAVAFILQFDMKTYADMTEYYITQIKRSNFFCPICGEEIKEEYVDTLRKETDYRRKLEWFYGEYCQHRMQDSKRLVDIAQKRGFDPLDWQIGMPDRPMSMRQYVSSRDNYQSELEKVKKNIFEESANMEKITTEEMTLEWLKKKKAAGFKFGKSEVKK